jgi:uncharacterized delta-60 repeat protein
MKKARILFFLISTLPGIVLAQATQEWVARYHGTGTSPWNDYDEAYAVAVDGSGYVYVTGVSTDSGTSEDYATIKYNSAGAAEWVARYNGTINSADYAYDIEVDNSGNVYVTGRSLGSGTGDDWATVKYNWAGAPQWIARYNGSANGPDCAYALTLDDSGNVYVTGWSFGAGTNLDYLTIKYNSSGAEQWVARYNGPGDSLDCTSSIAVDNAGNVYVTGRSFGSGANWDYATIKYNPAGAEQWVARYNAPENGDDRPYALTLDNAGNVYVTGVGSGNYATIKYNSAGVELWGRRYNSPGKGGGVARAIGVDNSGNVYVTGDINSLETQIDYATVKYNSAGDELWAARYTGPEYGLDQANALTLDNSGNVYVTGVSYYSETQYCDYVTIKYNSAGVEQWVARYNGTGDDADVANAIALDNAGNVYVTGSSFGSGTGYDYATIMYSAPDVGVISIDEPAGSVKVGHPVTPKATVENFGTVPVSFDVSCTIGGWTSTKSVVDLTLDFTRQVIFDDWTPTAPGIDTMTVITLLDEDANPTNDTMSKTITVTGITEAQNLIPRTFLLETARPNPTRDWTEIRYALPVNTQLALNIYDVTGKLVKTLTKDVEPAGYKTTLWDGRDNSGKQLPNGIYFIRFETPKYSATGKLVLTR